MIKLIATDIDGTLLDDNSQLPADFYEIYRELLKKGIEFVVASGRPYLSVKDVFPEIADNLICICDNGAYIKCGGNNPDISIIDPECVKASIELGRRLGVVVILCGVKGIFMNRVSESDFAEISKYYDSPIFTDDLFSVADGIFKITVFDRLGAEKNCADEFIKTFSADYNAQISGELWVDIMNKGINKGNALKKIQEKLGVLPEETMAFGDYLNDIELLSGAKMSFAVENAHPLVKKAARFIAPSNNENGVTTEIKKALNIKG